MMKKNTHKKKTHTQMDKKYFDFYLIKEHFKKINQSN